MCAAKTPKTVAEPTDRKMGNPDLISYMFHWPLLTERKKKPDWAVGKSGPITTKYLDYPLLAPDRKRDSAVGKARHVSTAFLNYPLLSPPQKRNSAVGKSGHVSTKYFSYPLISKR